MSKPKTMYGEASDVPTAEVVAASIPQNGRTGHVTLPPGVFAFDPKEFFKPYQAQGEAVCDILVAPFGCDALSLDRLPPAFRDYGYEGKAHWALNPFGVHTRVHTHEGFRSFVCPESVGVKPFKSCPLCTRRVEIYNATGKVAVAEYGRMVTRACFLAYINGTDKIYYIETRSDYKPRKGGSADDRTSAKGVTIPKLIALAQEDKRLPKTGFWATGSQPTWLRVRWKTEVFTPPDGSREIIYWDPVYLSANEVSLGGVTAAGAEWPHLGDPAYNVCHMITIPTKEEIAKIADSVCPINIRKTPAPKQAGDPCWDDIKGLDVAALIAYASAYGLDLSRIEPCSPRRFVLKKITDHFGITAPAQTDDKE